jgi:ferrous-iron efflux pump FieF
VHSSATTFIQLPRELAGDLSVLKAHKISDEVEANLSKVFPDSEVIILIDRQSVVGTEPMRDLD